MDFRMKNQEKNTTKIIFLGDRFDHQHITRTLTTHGE
jgi:hypothetical protein